MKNLIVIVLLIVGGCAANPRTHVDSGDSCPEVDSSLPMEDSSVVEDGGVEDSSVVDSAMEDSSVVDSAMEDTSVVDSSTPTCPTCPTCDTSCYFEWLNLYSCKIHTEIPDSCGNDQCGLLWDCIINHNLDPGDLRTDCSFE